MISPKLQNGDLVIENNDIAMIDNDEELIQSIKMLLSIRKGESSLDPEVGLSYNNVLGKSANQEEARDDIIEALSQDDRVASVTDIMFIDDFKNSRTRKISLTIEKADGSELTINEVELNA